MPTQCLMIFLEQINGRFSPFVMRQNLIDLIKIFKKRTANAALPDMCFQRFSFMSGQLSIDQLNDLFGFRTRSFHRNRL